MAGELTYNLNWQLDNTKASNGNMKENHAVGQRSVDVSADGKGGTTQTFTTGGEAFEALDNLSTFGFCHIENLEDSGSGNLIFGPQVGTGVVEDFGMCKPGEDAWLRLFPGISPMGKASTGTVLAKITVYED